MSVKSRLQKEAKQLSTIQKIGCSTDNLRGVSNLSLRDIFSSYKIDDIWFDSEKEIKQFNIPDNAGGVNPGDQRAIYYLINAINPISVLEVGTHIGASTIHIASALHKNSDKNVDITTVDIVDVNSRTEQQWSRYGTTHLPELEFTPLQMVEKLGYESFVEFVTADSFDYMRHCNRTFDFIFLDGNHVATTVYQEIPAALDLLNRDGVILLHDYFPGKEPLWSNGSVVPGPVLAVERLIEEGADMTALSLKELPWLTKCDSNVTSLALLLKN